ncbi:MAG TPA: hypothetical protein VIG78_10275, partial [Gemmatimonadaceae bacterium]
MRRHGAEEIAHSYISVSTGYPKSKVTVRFMGYLNLLLRDIGRKFQRVDSVGECVCDRVVAAAATKYVRVTARQSVEDVVARAAVDPVVAT